MNALNFLTAHIATILVVLAVLHTAVSSILGVLNKPKANSVFEQVWHYVQIVIGLGTKLAVSKDPTVEVKLDALTGDAKTLAGK